MKTIELLEVIKIFTDYHDGLLTEYEMESCLTKLPIEILELLPSNEDNSRCLRKRVIDLKIAIEKGETFTIKDTCK
jgi:hypothetical protein